MVYRQGIGLISTEIFLVSGVLDIFYFLEFSFFMSKVNPTQQPTGDNNNDS